MVFARAEFLERVKSGTNNFSEVGWSISSQWIRLLLDRVPAAKQRSASGQLGPPGDWDQD
jgi:hypothetical protein